MAGKIICWAISFGCAILFYSIGVYAKKCDKPMGFWSGSEVKPEQISDIKQYNKENSIMWKLYSLWYFAAGLARLWDSIVFAVILIMSCTVGLVLLILCYNRIFRKYRLY